MAPGDPLFELRAPHGIPPGATFATLGVLAGGSTPTENFYYYAFDASATEYMDFRVTMPGHYRASGLAMKCEIHMASATTGGVRIEAAIRRLDTGETLTASHSYTFQGVTVTVPGTLNRKVSGTILFSSAQIDSWAAEEEAVIRVRRKHDHSGDTATGDMYLACIYVRERSTGE